MAKKEHAALIQKSVKAWNAWRRKHPGLRPNLRSADLHALMLRGADLARTNLEAANLSAADLTGANLGGSRLYETHLEEAILDGANLGEATLDVEIIHVLRLRVGAEIRVVDVRGAGRSHVAQSAPRWRKREEFGADEPIRLRRGLSFFKIGGSFSTLPRLTLPIHWLYVPAWFDKIFLRRSSF